MFTKEQNYWKYCCFYVSDFHLEMILLPFIKENIGNSEIEIITENNLDETIKLLIDRTNFKIEEKNMILNLNWKKTDDIKEELFKKEYKKFNIIIIGSEEYIKNMNKKIKDYNLRKYNIIDCYNLELIGMRKAIIEKKYDKVLNTKRIVIVK